MASETPAAATTMAKDWRTSPEDNCPLQANPAQADIDGDGTGDRCDCSPEVKGVSEKPAASIGSLRIDEAGGTAILTWKRKTVFSRLTTTAAIDHKGQIGGTARGQVERRIKELELLLS